MSELSLSGKIIAIMPLKEGKSKSSGKEWALQQYVLETEDQYPKKMVFEIFGGDKINDASLRIDDVVTVHFDIDAREYQGKYFNTIRAWKIEKNGASSASSQPVASNNAAPVASKPQVQTQQPTQGADDLPF